MFLDIVFNLPIDKTFTYTVPDSLRDRVSVGKRVTAPFGRKRQQVGYIIGISEQYTGSYKLKNIIDVIDEQVVLTPELMQLAKWIAAYYLSSLGETLGCAVPYKPQTQTKNVKIISLKEPLSGEHIDSPLPELSDAQAKAIQLVTAAGDISLNELISDAGIGRSTINTLVKKGILSISSKQENRSPYKHYTISRSIPPIPTPDQTKASSSIAASISQEKFNVFLLHGVTGSGKTEVYLQAIQQALAINKTSLVLVPEISLTPQTVSRFVERFGQRVAVLHSRLSDGERYDEWQRVLKKEAEIVIGARSAIFAPLNRLGLLIVDEEHESSYKQFDPSPRYHARDVAVVRAKYENATVILGSATPSLESFYNTQIGKYQYLSLPARIDDRPMPQVEIIDMREEEEMFSIRLQQAIAQRIKNNQQTIVFLNRRGFAPFVQCRSCGLILKCPDCEITLTYHLADKRLKCHYCDYHQPAPQSCPECHGEDIRYSGIGTQKVAEELHRLFPEARIARMDVDTTSVKGSHEQILNSVRTGEMDILVGTQMIAKGHDFPNVTLVGVVSSDTGLNMPDFRSCEKTFSLLTQVAGRAGRGQIPGEVIIQTHSPQHYSIQAAINHNYQEFYDQEIVFRQELLYPPFTHLMNILIRGKDQERSYQISMQAAAQLKRNNGHNDIIILGPAACSLSKIKGYYRHHILLKSSKLQQMRKLATKSISELSLPNSVDIIMDMDPADML
ncbi:primosomal protein N' [Candidatus Desantisbacteria bacterium]|nr:primosomal protein N' [Candidatus Desantisbacteria bacterium]